MGGTSRFFFIIRQEKKYCACSPFVGGKKACSNKTTAKGHLVAHAGLGFVGCMDFYGTGFLAVLIGVYY